MTSTPPNAEAAESAIRQIGAEFRRLRGLRGERIEDISAYLNIKSTHIFGVEQAVVITQDFHLPRTLFTCRSLGIDAAGVIADQQPYSRRSLVWSTVREIPATTLAIADVIRRQPAPVMGPPIPLVSQDQPSP